MIKKHIGTEAVAYGSDGNIYLSEQFSNGLCVINIHSKKIQYITMFPDFGALHQNLHNAAISYKENIFFQCMSWNAIHKYVTTTKKIETITIDDICISMTATNLGLFVLLKNGKIKKYDVITNKFVESSLKDKVDFAILGYQNCTAYEKGFVIWSDEKYIIDVNVITNEVNRVCPGYTNVRNVYRINEDYLILFNQSLEIIVLRSDGTLKTIRPEQTHWIMGKTTVPYIYANEYMDYFFIVNYYASAPVIINKNDLSLVKLENIGGFNIESVNKYVYGGVYGYAVVTERGVVCVPCRCNTVSLLSCENGIWNKKEIPAYAEITDELLKRFPIVYEGDLYIQKEEIVTSEWPLKYLIAR